MNTAPKLPSADQLRLQMGELTPEEVLIAQAAYRLGAHEAALAPPSGEGVEARQAWYEREIATATSHWIDSFQERFEDGDDVPDKEHFVALWLAERQPPTTQSAPVQHGDKP